MLSRAQPRPAEQPCPAKPARSLPSQHRDEALNAIYDAQRLLPSLSPVRPDRDADACCRCHHRYTLQPPPTVVPVSGGLRIDLCFPATYPLLPPSIVAVVPTAAPGSPSSPPPALGAPGAARRRPGQVYLYGLVETLCELLVTD